jgi:hypothetical protein
MTRERVEPGIWRRGEAFEITWRDAEGKQRGKSVQGGITAARKALTDPKSKHERALEPKRLELLPGGHFDAYVADFERASGAARDWFVEHLVAV